MFGCKICSNTYQRLSSLRRHASEKHPLDVDSIIEIHIDKKFKCTECGKRFNNKQSFSRHERLTHNIKYVRKNQLYQCALCVFKHYEKTKVLAHISAEHNLDVAAEPKEFQSEQDFLQWKANEEINGNCKFIATGGKHKYQRVRNQTLACNRSQCYMSKVSLKRALKLEAGCKPRSCKSRSQLSAFCPAEIKYTETDGVYKVSYIKMHTHRLDFKHIKLTSVEKSDITKKLSAGISFNKILDQVRHSLYQGKEMKRKFLLTRKELLNIEECFSLHGEQQQHKSEELNFDAWVRQETETNWTPSILFYKPLGQLSADFSNLNMQDFVLILMNELQSDILKAFGTDTLCLDSTQELDHYDFHLITLSVIDDSGQGFPCVFLITNRCDSVITRLLFSEVKKRIGDICAENFMTGLDKDFFNCYKSIMPLVKNNLFCSWHVDRAWRQNLTTIESIEKQIEVYKILRTMLEEPDENSFNALFTEAKTFLVNDKDTKEFGNYFVNNFEHNMKSWAFCFRVHNGINTNVHLERLYRTVKHIYCNKKKVKHLDDTLCILQKFVRDYLLIQLMQRHKEIIISKKNHFKFKHRESLELDPVSIIEYENKWVCSPSSKSSQLFYIQRDQHFEQCQCEMKCPICNFCIHNFVCTCVDHSVRWNICKHIHLLCRSRFETDTESTLDDLDVAFNDAEETSGECITIIMEPNKNKFGDSEQETLQEEKCNIMKLFKNMIDGANIEQVRYIKTKVIEMKGTIDDMKRQHITGK